MNIFNFSLGEAQIGLMTAVYYGIAVGFLYGLIRSWLIGVIDRRTP